MRYINLHLHYITLQCIFSYSIVYLLQQKFSRRQNEVREMVSTEICRRICTFGGVFDVAGVPVDLRQSTARTSGRQQ